MFLLLISCPIIDNFVGKLQYFNTCSEICRALHFSKIWVTW